MFMGMDCQHWIQLLCLLLIVPYGAGIWQIHDVSFQKVIEVHEQHNHNITIVQQWGKSAVLFAIGGISYYCIEILYRGYSHYTMILLGGECFLQLGIMNEVIAWNMCIEYQALLGALIATVNELIAGLIINVGMGYNVWDYSNQPFNLFGQICLLFTFYWIFIALFGIIVDDVLRYYIWKEERPKYRTAIFKKTFELPIPRRPGGDACCG